MQPIDAEYVLPTALIEVMSWISFGVGVLAAVVYSFLVRDFSFLLFIAVIIGLSVVIWAMGAHHPGTRFLLAIFFAAFGLRLLATILFHNAGRMTGDAFAGSPDAWRYDRWANWAVDFWLRGDFPSLSGFDLTGTWDVGFFYILAGTYLIFGQSPLVGRVLVVLFGALAALVFYLLARELVGERAGRIAGVIYAFWPVSILWTGYSILRDSLVWFLILLSILLVLRVIRGSRLAVVSLLISLVVLRFVRSYAEFIILFGLGIGALWWFLHFDRRFVRAALTFCAVVVAVEGIVSAVGGAGVSYMVKSYSGTAVQYTMKSLPTSPPPDMTAPGPAERPMIAPVAQPSKSVNAPPHLTSPGLLTNSVRFFFGPFAWAPDVPNAGNWQLPAMWFWYAILPAAICGVFLGLRKGPALRIVFLTFLVLIAALVVAGRGDSFRHREMITPFFILGFVLSIGFVRRYWRPFLLLYVVYLIGLTGLIVYHRHTLKQRGMIATIQQPHPRSLLWTRKYLPL